MAHHSLSGNRRSTRLQSRLADGAHGAMTISSPPAVSKAPVTASCHSQLDLSGRESSQDRRSDASPSQQAEQTASKSNALLQQRCGNCDNCIQPWLNQACCEHSLADGLDPSTCGTNWPGNEAMEGQPRSEECSIAFLEPKQMAVRERQLQRQMITDGILDGSFEDRQQSRRDTVTKQPVQSAAMAHRHMLRHVRHQQHIAEAQDDGLPALNWAQLQVGSESADVVPHLRADAATACPADAVSTATARSSRSRPVAIIRKVFRRAPPANAPSPKRRRRSVAPEVPVEGLTRDMAALPPALRDAMAAMQQFAVEAAHEQGMSTGEKAKVVAAFSPDALTVAGLFSAEVLRTALKAAMLPYGVDTMIFHCRTCQGKGINPLTGLCTC